MLTVFLASAGGRRRQRWLLEEEARSGGLANTTVADPTCHAKANAGYAGDGAVVWGTNFHTADAAECCRACQAHARVCGRPDSAQRSWWPDKPRLLCGKASGCNIWSFCPGSPEVADQCFAFDIHRHARGECWLKLQRATPERPKDPFMGHTTFPAAMRAAPRRQWPFAVAL